MRQERILRFGLSILIVSTVGLLGFAKEETVASAWTPTPLKIDGSPAEWEGSPSFTHPKTKVDVTFRNDPEYLYVLFKFNDPKYLSSIRQTGLTLYFNTEGKKKKHYGVNFIQTTVSADEFIKIVEEAQGPIPEERKAQIKMQPQYIVHNIKVVGKAAEAKAKTPPEAKARPCVFKASKQQNAMVYELAIPLKRLAAHLAGVGAEPGATVKVGFEWGGMTKEMRKQYMSRRAAAGSRGRQGASRFVPRDTSGDTGAAAASRNMPFSKTPKRYTFWLDLKLANPQG